MDHNTQSFDMSSESGVDNGLQSDRDVVYRGFLDLPSDMLIKILSSIPVKERVRASRTCKAFYNVLSGPQTFSDVKRLPGPELSGFQLIQIIDCDVETKTQSAMAKRLCTSVKFLDLSLGCFSEWQTSLFGLLSFLSEFQHLTELEIDDCYVKSDNVLHPRPQKVQVSKVHFLLVSNPQALSCTTFLNELEYVLDFGSVRDLTVVDYNCTDLKCFLEHDLKNLQKLDLALLVSECRILGDLIMKNVECLKHVSLSAEVLEGDQELFLTALGQLHLEYLDLCFQDTGPDRWLIDLAANSVNTLEYLRFQPQTEHDLDFIPQQQFKKLTNMILKDVPQCLTSVISFIEGRPAGLPKMRLECGVTRKRNETDQQMERLEALVISEADKFDFHFDKNFRRW